jgi:nucleoside-diphosphate-sugar epimerase
MSRVFVAGATGVIGIRLVPLLVADGHIVAGMTRSASKADALRALGAEPVVCDVYDAPRLKQVVAAFRPEVMVHELTDLPDNAAEIRQRAGANARIRREGTANLVAAARAAGVKRFLAQSVSWVLPGDGEAAKQELERMVLGISGVVLRYGQLYGAGTYHEQTLPDPPRVQVDEAARRTAGLLHAPSGIVIIEDQAPAAGGN